jgi:peptide deformylase
MIETMYAVDGVGLAAPQVGVSKKIAVIDVGEGPIALINPKIIEGSGEDIDVEGCLSVPGKQAYVKRMATVKVQAFNEKGKPVQIEAEGLLARALQHEIDHLNGILFTDLVDEKDIFEGEE